MYSAETILSPVLESKSMSPCVEMDVLIIPSWAKRGVVFQEDFGLALPLVPSFKAKVSSSSHSRWVIYASSWIQ